MRPGSAPLRRYTHLVLFFRPCLRYGTVNPSHPRSFQSPQHILPQQHILHYIKPSHVYKIRQDIQARQTQQARTRPVEGERSATYSEEAKAKEEAKKVLFNNIINPQLTIPSKSDMASYAYYLAQRTNVMNLHV